MEETRWNVPSIDETETYVHGMFVTPAAQLARVERWNAVRGWGFSLHDFRKAANVMPAWPEAPNCALVLIPYLGADDRGALTAQELGRLAASRVNPLTTRIAFVRECMERLVLPRIALAERRLAWETVWTAPPTPAAAILATLPLIAAAAHHPLWIVAMEQGVVPDVTLPGTQGVPSATAPKWPKLRGSVGDLSPALAVPCAA